MGLAEPGPIERVANRTSVGEMRLRSAAADVGPHRVAALCRELVRLLVEEQHRDVDEFVVAVIGEVDVMGDPRPEPGVGAEETFHPIGVSGQDHHKILALLLHHLQQDLDRLLTIVALVPRAVQVIGFVDEEHATECSLDDLLRLRRGVADVLADEVVTRHADHARRAQVAEAVENVGHRHRNRGLAGPRVAGKAHMERGRVGRQPEPMAHPIDQEQRRDLGDALLDRREADEVGVEVGEEGVDPGLATLRVEVDGFGSWRQRLHRTGPEARTTWNPGSTSGRPTMNDSRTLSQPRVDSNATRRM